MKNLSSFEKKILQEKKNLCIDFDKELELHKEKTEMELPYTGTVAEDAMYINQQTIVVLEYNNY